MTRLLTQGEIPETLYKYRSWSNESHKRLITHQEIFFSKPSSFNDPYDGNNPIRWDLLTDNDCYNKNLELVKFFCKDKPSEFQKKIALQITNSKKFWHPDHIHKESQNDIKKWDNIIGLLSLSENPDEILMWSHYADNHKGFIVGFKTKSFIEDYDFDYLGKLNYLQDYPIITGHHSIDERFMLKFFTKSITWAYEQEWRISKNHIDNRIRILRKETYSKIILGCQMPEKDKLEIIKLTSKIFGNSVSILQAEKSDSEFKLKMVSI